MEVYPLVNNYLAMEWPILIHCIPPHFFTFLVLRRSSRRVNGPFDYGFDGTLWENQANPMVENDARKSKKITLPYSMILPLWLISYLHYHRFWWLYHHVINHNLGVLVSHIRTNPNRTIRQVLIISHLFSISPSSCAISPYISMIST